MDLSFIKPYYSKRLLNGSFEGTFCLFIDDAGLILSVILTLWARNRSRKPKRMGMRY